MKSIFRLAVACIAVLGATTVQVQAKSITTLYDCDNVGNTGGNVYFDIEVLNPAGITIEKLFVNTSTTSQTGEINVYARPGTYSGFERDETGWRKVSFGTGSLMGYNNPSEFDVSDFFLRPGVVGVAIESERDVWAHHYTDGDGSNQFYSNSDLSLTLGSASNIGFAYGDLSFFSPRVWNGTIEYRAGTIPEPSTMLLFGTGIAGLAAVGRRRRK